MGQRAGVRGKGEGGPVLGINGDLGGEGASSKGRGGAFWQRGGEGAGKSIGLEAVSATPRRFAGKAPTSSVKARRDMDRWTTTAAGD